MAVEHLAYVQPEPLVVIAPHASPTIRRAGAANRLHRNPSAIPKATRASRAIISFALGWSRMLNQVLRKVEQGGSAAAHSA